MMRCLLILTLIAWTVTSAVADTPADSFFDQLFWDVGTVPGATTYHHYFEVTNKSDKPVRITSIRVSCGCVSASAVKNDLAPGEKTILVARMESRQFNGMITKTIFVLFDQAGLEEVRIRVQANVLQDLAISPSVPDFGKMKKGSSPERDITVSYGSYRNSPIESVKSESGYVQVKLAPMSENTGMQSYRVTAKISPDLPVGSWHSMILLVSSNPNQPPINIPMKIEIVP